MPAQGTFTFTNNATITPADAATIASITVVRDRFGAPESRILVEVHFGKALLTSDPVSGNAHFDIIGQATVFNHSFGAWGGLLAQGVATGEFTQAEVDAHLANLLAVDETMRQTAETLISFGRRLNSALGVNNIVYWPNYIVRAE
jgi:hypothetical protein